MMLKLLIDIYNLNPAHKIVFYAVLDTYGILGINHTLVSDVWTVRIDVLYSNMAILLVQPSEARVKSYTCLYPYSRQKQG